MASLRATAAFVLFQVSGLRSICVERGAGEAAKS
jgi:hypothetical protein